MLALTKMFFICTDVCKHSQRCFSYTQIQANTHNNALHMYRCMQALIKMFSLCTDVCKPSQQLFYMHRCMQELIKMFFLCIDVCKHSQKCSSYAQIYASTHKNVLYILRFLQASTKMFFICMEMCTECSAYLPIYANRNTHKNVLHMDRCMQTHKNIPHMHKCMQVLTKMILICTDMCKHSQKSSCAQMYAYSLKNVLYMHR